MLADPVQDLGAVEHGYLAIFEVLFSLATGELGQGLVAARTAFETGERFGDPDLEAMGLMLEGVVLIGTGDSDAGTARLDEAMAMASSGGLGLSRRASSPVGRSPPAWTSGTIREPASGSTPWGPWVDSASIIGFPGDCRAHRADLLLVQGSWEAEETEARRACGECEAFDLTHSGLAYNDIRLLRLRRGDQAGAQEAFGRAQALGVVPKPGHALLHLTLGEVAAALESIVTALADQATEPLARAKLLPAL